MSWMHTKNNNQVAQLWCSLELLINENFIWMDAQFFEEDIHTLRFSVQKLCDAVVFFFKLGISLGVDKLLEF